MEISDRQRNLLHIGCKVSGLMYKEEYTQIEQLYRELIENGTIKPIEYINRIEDEDVELLMLKFYIEFKEIKEEGLPIPYNEDDILP